MLLLRCVGASSAAGTVGSIVLKKMFHHRHVLQFLYVLVVVIVNGFANVAAVCS